DVIDDLVVGLAFRKLAFSKLKSFIVLLALRCGGMLPCRTRLVIRDNATNGRENLLHRRFRSTLRTAHDLIPYRHHKPPRYPAVKHQGCTWVCNLTHR